MEAPRLRSMFRNVRTDPKRFEFKSRHLPDVKVEWQERKQRIEQEVLGVEPEQGPAQIRFRKSRASTSSATEDRRARRLASIRDARRSMFRAVVIAAVLVFAAWEGLKWVEASDFGGVLDFLKQAK